MCFKKKTAYFVDNQEAIINPWCRCHILLNYIKKVCDCEDEGKSRDSYYRALLHRVFYYEQTDVVLLFRLTSYSVSFNVLGYIFV